MVESKVVRTATMLLIGLTLGGCTPMDDLLSGIFGRSMRSQPSLGAYESPRLPPEGSVPFAAPNYPASPDQVGLGQPEGSEIPPMVTPFQLLTGAAEAQPAIDQPNPVPATAASLERGRVMYERSCVPCHASTGAGDGPVTRSGVPPRSLLTAEARALSDGYIYTIIRVGRGAMPQYGHQITHFDRWHVVNYVRQLQAGDADDA
jgi:mono/diheme cytochrome c family protein